MLDLKDVSISYSQKKVLDGVSFSVSEKEKLAIVGGNGTGKTTLAFFLARVIPDFIEAEVSGKASISEKSALILQNPSSQFFSMTVEEELGAAKTSGFSIGHLLSRNVFELSEGEKQKINLIANLALNPSFLSLDEPLELLDPLEAKRFLKIIKKVKHTPLLWFDKSNEFVKDFRKISLGKKPSYSFPQKKKSSFGKKVLQSSFSIQKNGFSLSNIEFSLKKGEKIALIGYNGSGKTSILKALAGMEKVKGSIAKKIPFGFAPQNPSYLFFQETVGQEIACSEKARRLCLKPLLSRDPAKLSKGQQKLLSIATVPSNTIALLDEPTTWLDPFNKSLVYDLINQSTQSMVIATHDKKLLDYCDRVFLVGRNKGVKECSSTAVNRFFLA